MRTVPSFSETMTYSYYYLVVHVLVIVVVVILNWAKKSENYSIVN